VNFFGHAAVATWQSPAPGRVLGAMLPDFATMSGARLSTTTPSPDADVATGIDLHHTTDAVFHRLPPVLALMRELDERLAKLGCARGPRRAVAHIGVELLLDGVLVDEIAYSDAYVAGLAHSPDGIAWRESDDPPRFARLLDRLRSYGVPLDLQRPESIAQRLHRMLAHRPLLAPNASDLVAIKTALVDHKPRVEVAADTVLRALRAGL
jgi:acyl carrier protein phosphodiesterase